MIDARLRAPYYPTLLLGAAGIINRNLHLGVIMVKVRCPSCDKSLNVPDAYAGKKAKCPACQENLTLPEAPVEVTPLVPASSRSGPPPLPEEDYDDRPRRRPRDDDYDDRPRRRGRVGGEWAPCPNCGHDEATRLHWTFWGSMIGPAIINVVRCGMCGTNYNGVHGDYNYTRIAIYMAVSTLVGLMIVGAIIALEIMT